MILDPRDEEIDREFGIDRSKPGIKPQTIYYLYLENGPDSLNASAIMQNFDLIYEQLRPKE